MHLGAVANEGCRLGHIAGDEEAERGDPLVGAADEPARADHRALPGTSTGGVNGFGIGPSLAHSTRTSEGPARFTAA